MRKLLLSNAFGLAFAVVMLFFLAANIYTTLPEMDAERITFDKGEVYGFPFAFFESGTSVKMSQFVWAGIVANFTAAIIISFVASLIIKFFCEKVATKNLS